MKKEIKTFGLIICFKLINLTFNLNILPKFYLNLFYHLNSILNTS